MRISPIEIDGPGCAFMPRPELRRQFLPRLTLLRNCRANLLGREIGSRHSFLLQPLEELQEWVVRAIPAWFSATWFDFGQDLFLPFHARIEIHLCSLWRLMS
jgi:hypothetical protein